MGENTGHDSGQDIGRQRHRRWLGTGYAGAALATMALLVTACSSGSSGPGVANAGSSKSASSSASAPAGKSAALAYSKCMRSHGITNFPDPSANGGISIDGKTVNQNTPQYTSANQACQSLLPAPPPGGAPTNRGAALNYSKCMRTHGVKKFPDPNANGGIDLNAGTLGVDPNGTVFKNADKACQHLMGNGSGPSTNGH